MEGPAGLEDLAEEARVDLVDTEAPAVLADRVVSALPEVIIPAVSEALADIGPLPRQVAGASAVTVPQTEGAAGACCRY